MSTTQRELEELRKVREAERLQKEILRREEEEKAAKIAKKNAFLNRAAIFTKKAGPTDEEVKLSVQKASKQRKFGRELNKLLQSQPEGKSAIATELHLKGKYGDGNQYETRPVKRSSISSIWEIVEQAGGRPYYWNRITNETTYDPPSADSVPPPPPPPPPRFQLPGLVESQAIAAGVDCEEEGHIESETAEYTAETENAELSNPHETSVQSGWTLVQEENQPAYYWNTVTNETTFELPEGVPYTLFEGSDSRINTTTDTTGEPDDFPPISETPSLDNATAMWQEITSPNGEMMYTNLENGECRSDKPNGTTIIVCEEVDGETNNWQECIGCNEEGDGHTEDSYFYYYQNLNTGEVSADRPVGLVMIAETAE